MKRWITGCLALLLALTAAGCSGVASPEERFGAVVQQAAELSSMEVDADTRIRMALGQEVLDQTSETAAQLFRDGETLLVRLAGPQRACRRYGCPEEMALAPFLHLGDGAVVSGAL